MVSKLNSILRSHVPGFLKRVQECNIGSELLNTLTPLIVDGKIVGKLVPRSFNILSEFTDCFESSDASGPDGFLRFLPSIDTVERRNKIIAKVSSTLRDRGVINGWRDELYPVSAAFQDAPAFLLERAAVTFFGVKAYGVHVNGYVVRKVKQDEPGSNASVSTSAEDEEAGLFGPANGEEIHLWVARRSRTKPTWPGLLDHIVAGGQPYDLTCSSNVLKECAEEAGMPYSLASRARPVGIVSYENVDLHAGYKHDVLFCYDIKLPEDFVPKPADGEVESFQLLPAAEVAALVAALPTGEFKPNCCLVIADFFVRHGLLSPDWPGYLELVQGLRKA